MSRSYILSPSSASVACSGTALDFSFALWQWTSPDFLGKVLHVDTPVYLLNPLPSLVHESHKIRRTYVVPDSSVGNVFAYIVDGWGPIRCGLFCNRHISNDLGQGWGTRGLKATCGLLGP
jgi:hypothetical protein